MTGNDAFTKILLHFDGTNGSTTITDNNVGGSAHVWTANSVTIDTSQSKFGGASLNCGAAAGCVSTPDGTDFTLGSGDWTVDLWFNRQGGDGTPRRFGGQENSSGTDLSIELTLNGANKVQCFLSSDGATGSNAVGTTAITATGWHHFAIVRTGTILKLFLDGVQDNTDFDLTTVTNWSGSIHDSASVFSVGRSGASTGKDFNGFIDEFRLSVGIARWTANFTPPTSAYGILNLGLSGVG